MFSKQNFLNLILEEGQAVGAFTFVLPIIHPVAKSFKDFTPILAEMLPEGAFLYISDLHKVIRMQGSIKFDVPTIQLNYELKEDDIASLTASASNIHINEQKLDTDIKEIIGLSDEYNKANHPHLSLVRLNY